MEGCLLCLEINKDLGDFITVNSTQWKQLNIENIIEKHLWNMETLKTSSWLCTICWQELYDFHKFYIRIEEAQMEFGSLEKIKSEANLNYTKDNNDLGTETDKNVSYTINDLNDTHYETEIIINETMPIEVVMEDEKPIIKKENDDELFKDEDDDDDDNMPLKQIRKRELRSKDLVNYTEGNAHDPLNESKKIKKSKSGNIKSKKPKKSNTASEQQPIKKLKIKVDPDMILNSEELNILHDLPDNDDINYSDDTDSNYEPDNDSNNEPDGKPLKTNKNKKRSNKDNNNTSRAKSIENNKFLAEHFKIMCVVCTIPMESFTELRKHFEVEHQTRGYVICCNRKFFKCSRIVEHIQRHLNPSDFKCETCGKVMSDRRGLELHINAHEGKFEKNCDICGKGFNNAYTLKMHRYIHLSEEEKTIPCPECDKNFANNYFLSSHIRSVHLKKNSVICYICGKELRDKPTFDRHMLEHEGKPIPTVTCDICGAQLVNKKGLKKHKAAIHPIGGKQEHICPLCSLVSPNLGAHKKHYKYQHESGCDHKCTICEKSFKRALALTEHMAIHTGTILYTCPWCPKTFNSSANLHNHRKKHHPLEWEEEVRKKYSGNLPPNYYGKARSN